MLGKGSFFNDVPAKGTWEVDHVSAELECRFGFDLKIAFCIPQKRIIKDLHRMEMLNILQACSWTHQACLVPTKSDIVHLVVRYLDSGGRGAYSAFKALTGKAFTILWHPFAAKTCVSWTRSMALTPAYWGQPPEGFCRRNAWSGAAGL